VGSGATAAAVSNRNTRFYYSFVGRTGWETFLDQSISGDELDKNSLFAEAERRTLSVVIF